MKYSLLLVITCPAWTDDVILPARKDLSYQDIPEIIKQSPPLKAEKSKILVSSSSFYFPLNVPDNPTLIYVVRGQQIGQKNTSL